jgi:hypothetical protein
MKFEILTLLSVLSVSFAKVTFQSELFDAAEAGNVDKLSMIIPNGDINTKDGDGNLTCIILINY